MNQPLISVIIPIYNVEKYLRLCVDSVIAQSYKNLDIILVDDGSPDGSPAICDQYAKSDYRIKVIHKVNGGLSDARNVGIESSSGEYIFFLDADDYLAPDCIKILIEASSDGALPISGYKLDYSNQGKVSNAYQAYDDYQSLKEYLSDFHNLFATKFNFAWGKLYCSKIIRENNIRFLKDISLVEDILFNLEYYRHCHKGIKAIHYDGYYYRQHGGSTLSKKFDQRMFDWNELCYTAVREFLKEYGCFSDKNREHLYRNIAGNYQYGFYLIANNPKMDIRDKETLIRKYITTPIYLDSLTVKQKKRVDYQLLQWLLKHDMIRTYISLELFKRKYLHGGN